MGEFISTDDAAKILGVSARRVRAMIAAGQLPNTQSIGSEGKRPIHLIARADLDAVKGRKAGRPKKAAPLEGRAAERGRPKIPSEPSKAKPKRKKGGA